MSTYVYTGRMTTLPALTVGQCDQITGLYIGRDHAAHTVYTTRATRYGVRNVPIGKCPGRHTAAVPVVPPDPFALIPGAHEDDRDL